MTIFAAENDGQVCAWQEPDNGYRMGAAEM